MYIYSLRARESDRMISGLLSKKRDIVMSETDGFAYAINESDAEELPCAVLDTLQDEVFVVSVDFRVVLANARVKERIGDVDPVKRRLTCREVHNRSSHPCGDNMQPCIVREVFQTSRPSRSRHVVLDDFGNTIVMDASAAPIFDDAGNVQFVVQTLRDASAAVVSEEAHDPRAGEIRTSSAGGGQFVSKRGRYIKRMEQLSNIESLGALTEQIAHDFNNLMGSILSNTEFLLETVALDSPSRECLLDISDAAKRAVDLTRQMSAYAGRHSFAQAEVNLIEVLQGSERIIGKSVPGYIALRYDLEKGPLTIKGDHMQTRRIILNLISNAVDAIGASSGIIKVSAGKIYCDAAYIAGLHGSETVKEGMYAFVEVSDTGCGMDADTVSKIFDPFFTTKLFGRGLGLAVVLGIVQNFRGTVEVFSIPDEGSKFKVLLPICEIDVAFSCDNGSSEDEEASPFFGKKLLLVDDDRAIRTVAKHMISSLGFEVEVAEGGVETLDILRRQNDIDIVVLDFSMPGMDGESCFYAIREIDKNIPVVLSSGHCEQELTGRFQNSGLSGYLQKPYCTEQLADILLGALCKS